MMAKEKGVSGFWYLLGGAAAGTALGVLLAPKKGSETRKDLNEWSRRSGEKARIALSKIGGRAAGSGVRKVKEFIS
jgi:gas vesicle protein